MRIGRNLLILAVLCPLLAYLAMPFMADEGEQAVYAAENSVARGVQVDEEMRGLWVSSVINLDYPSAPTVDSDKLMAEADEILDNAEDWGMNAIFLQVTPCADALYNSDRLPWSVYLTGEQGKAPSGDFDPLEYWVSEAHKRGMELHAWVNPFRITRAAAEWDKMVEEHPAKLHPEWVVQHKGNYYFNPGEPEARKAIINSIIDIVDGYEVDGIHLDDYFYPGTDFNDSASYAAYGEGMELADWRRDNINTFVKELSDSLNGFADSAEFGISPAGVWASKTLNPLGSDTTSTFSSYYGSYADTRLWVKEGWVDYIAPQIYWERGHKTADFTALLDWWSDLVKGTDVDLYIGLADYKTLEAKASDSPWYDGREIAGQIADCAATGEVDGVIHFRYGSVKSSPALQRVITAAASGERVAVSGNAVSGAVSVVVDGTKLSFDTPPYIESGRVLLPMRVIFEAFGATVDYSAGKIVAQRGETVVRLELGSNKMLVGSDGYTLDVPAKAVGGRTMLPLRAVSEALSASVDWNGSNKTVAIVTQ